MDIDHLIRNVLWNGFLAIVPVALAYTTLWVSRLRKWKPARNLVILGLSAVWLAYLPNTCYLLTEWRHFLWWVDVRDNFVRSQADKTVLLQLCALSLFYFLYSGFGMLTFALAIRPMEQLASRRGAAIRFWALPFFTALSLGVYLGLILRFNSWDLWHRPGIIWSAFVDVGGRPRLTAFIFGFGLFLWAAYEAIDIWIDGLTDRWSRVTGRQIHLGPRKRSPDA